MTRDELIDDVLELTNARPVVIERDEVDNLMSIGEDEINGRVGEEIEFFGSSKSETAQRALFWLTCLFVKIRSGEINGARVRINDLEVQPLSE